MDRTDFRPQAEPGWRVIEAGLYDGDFETDTHPLAGWLDDGRGDARPVYWSPGDELLMPAAERNNDCSNTMLFLVGPGMPEPTSVQMRANVKAKIAAHAAAERAEAESSS